MSSAEGPSSYDSTESLTGTINEYLFENGMRVRDHEKPSLIPWPVPNGSPVVDRRADRP